MKNGLPLFFLFAFFLFVGAACSLPQSLLLTPGRDFSEVVEQESSRLIVQRFSEDFFKNGVVGSHFVGQGQQDLQLKSQRLAKALDVSLGNALAAKNIFFARGDNWDLTLAGLDQLKGRGLAVVGGRINSFSIEAKTGFGRLSTQISLAISVDCLVGLPEEGKIVRKTVYIEEKMFKFSANQRSMEKAVDLFLEGVAAQLVDHISKSI